ncbi:MAG: PEP-CTERM sorting domain-containing protein [Bryobacteraceae bacterium]|nr:PEP-CTERM sorting domain-containing protein [Bryobacteraceae bacterium]
MRRATLLLLSLACLLGTAAQAAPITYRFSGSGSGVLGDIPFSEAAFVATVNGDTDDVAFQPPLAAVGALDLTGSILISGLGTFSFSNPLFVFIAFDTVGFGDFTNGNLIVSLVPGSEAHGLVTNFGPALGGPNTNVNQFVDAATSGGALSFRTMSDITYEASTNVVPEPGSVLLMAGGMGALLLVVRRRRN